MFNVSIPKLSEEELFKWYQKIVPIVKIGSVFYHLKNNPFEQISTMAYLWNIKENIGDEIEADKIVALKEKDFYCLHKYGYYGLFKPSVAEVLSQINEEDFYFVDAFEIIESPENLTKDWFSNIAFQNGYHVSKVRLYKILK